MQYSCQFFNSIDIIPFPVNHPVTIGAEWNKIGLGIYCDLPIDCVQWLNVVYLYETVPNGAVRPLLK